MFCSCLGLRLVGFPAKALVFAVLVLLSLQPTRAEGQQSLTERLNSAIGVATQGDIVKVLGIPAGTLRAGDDDLWIYLIRETNPWADAGDILSGFSAGVQGRPYTPSPRQRNQLILQFDGRTGKLTEWTVVK